MHGYLDEPELDKSLTMNHNMNRNEQIVYLPQLERFESSPLESGWAFPHFVPIDLSYISHIKLLK